MVDSFTLEKCKEDKELLEFRIKSIEHAIRQSEEMILEFRLDSNALIFLRRKIAESMQDLEVLYLLKQP